jgi:lipid II:glycine glycyltransferase (peptidoglycan interpeptide bridge formation enzyme)
MYQREFIEQNIVQSLSDLEVEADGAFEVQLWQSAAWASFSQKAGIPQQLIVLRQEQSLCGWVLVTFRKLGPVNLYGAVRRGPAAVNTEAAAELLKAAAGKCCYLLTDASFPAESYHELRGLLFSKFKTKRESFGSRCFVFDNVTGQIPPLTRVLDLKQSESDILAGMKKKGRYNIKLAIKRGVEVRQGSVEEFYPLIKATAARQGIPCFSEQMFERMCEEEGCFVFTALCKGEPAASAVLFIQGVHADYLYGGMDTRFSSDMPAYLLQWEMVKFAKSQGSEIYDFCGISPDGVAQHYLKSVSDFKAKFGGYVVEYCRTFNMISGRFRFSKFFLYKTIESVKQVKYLLKGYSKRG